MIIICVLCIYNYLPKVKGFLVNTASPLLLLLDKLGLEKSLTVVSEDINITYKRRGGGGGRINDIRCKGKKNLLSEGK